MTTATKKAIQSHVNKLLISTGDSQNRLATKIGISGATLSNLMKEELWHTISDEMWTKIATETKFKEGEWQAAPTTNYKMMFTLLRNSQRMSTATLVCDEPGWGKSFSCDNYQRTGKNVFKVECEEHFTRKVFLDKLMKSMGLSGFGMKATDQLEAICDHLKTLQKPLVIIHHNARPKDSTMMIFIAMYNALENYCGFMMCGTKALGNYIEKNAHRNKLGYKELYSRLGRNVLRLEQPSKRDVAMICNANGVTDEVEITKIFNQSDLDLRRVKLDIQLIVESLFNKAA